MRRSRLRALAIVLGVALALIGFVAANRTLLRTPPDEVPGHPLLTAFARVRAAPAYLVHCAGCHGFAGRGDPVKGAPDLMDGKWLHGTSDVSDIERTMLFGIRSGDPRARNVADMPAFFYEGRLARPEIAAVANYVLAIGGRPHAGDPRRLAWGREIYRNQGVCYDCHGPTGAGVPDFGAPSFREMNLIHGTDLASIERSVTAGRHGICPAWSGTIGAATIRALAVALHEGNR